MGGYNARAVFKSIDGGENWSDASDGIPTGCSGYALAIDPLTPSTVYVGAGCGTGSGVFKSTNGGGNWTAINTGLPGWLAVSALAIDPQTTTTLYRGTEGGGIYKSTDGGANWSDFNTGLTNSDVRALAIDPLAPTTLYAGTWGSGVFSLQEPAIAAGPGALDFGVVGEILTVTVGNVGTGDLTLGVITLGGANPDQFKMPVALDFCSGQTLVPTHTCTVGVRFKPTNGGHQNATLLIPSNDLDLTPVMIALDGAEGRPEVTVDPAAIDYGTVYVGTKLGKTVTIRNDGTGDLTVGIVTLAGTNSNQFRVPAAKDCCSGRTLAPAASCTVAVKFVPSNAGTQSATLMIPSNDFNENPASVALEGTGGGPEITVDPTAVDYGAVPVGTKRRKTVTVRNDGSGDLTVGVVTLAGANPDQFRVPAAKDLCSEQTLAPMARCTVEVKFAPSNVGPQSAVLVIPSDDFNESPVTVTLDGTGTAP